MLFYNNYNNQDIHKILQNQTSAISFCSNASDRLLTIKPNINKMQSATSRKR